MNNIFLLAAACLIFCCQLSLADNSVEDSDSIKTAYYQWLHSPAGEEALKNGYFVPTDRSESKNIERFQDSYHRMKQLQTVNRNAELSMNTPFSMMTSEEFMAIFKQSPQVKAYRPVPTEKNPASSVTSKSLQKNIDWTTASYCVGEVRNQFQCGSCWAFAAVAALESAYCLKTGLVVSLSEQHLVSCNHLNYGCGGGWVDRAYDWMMEYNSRGLCSSEEYPYQAKDTECRQCDVSQIDLKSYVQLQQEDQALEALYKEPLAVYVAVTDSWSYYSSGHLNISNEEPNHVVLLVGYDSAEGGTWKLRNSWGNKWGMDGFLNAPVGYGGIQFPIYPIF